MGQFKRWKVDKKAMGTLLTSYAHCSMTWRVATDVQVAEWQSSPSVNNRRVHAAELVERDMGLQEVRSDKEQHSVFRTDGMGARRRLNTLAHLCSRSRLQPDGHSPALCAA